MKEKIVDRKPIQLAWPIFIELLLFMIMGNVDTIMLSRFSDLAVAAVGNANQLISTVLIIFTVTSTAASILLAQYLGASKKKDIHALYTLSFSLNLMAVFLITLAFMALKMKFFSLLKVEVILYDDMLAYMDVVIKFLFIPVMFSLFSALLKAHGQTKLPMFLSVGMNLINVVGNYIFLFGPFGLPILGVRGVAISTVVSRGIALVIMVIVLVKKYDFKIGLSKITPFPKDVMHKFLKVGIPSAAEPMSYQLSQMFILAFINSMGSLMVTTRVYIQIIVWFTYLGTVAMAQGNQIIVGHLVGAKRFDEVESMTRKTLKQSLTMTLSISLLIAIFRYPILGLFTENETILEVGARVLLLDFFVELGRVFNIVIIWGLKATGDVKYPVFIGVFSMWLISTLGSYVLGVYFGLGLAGIWVAMALDEILRGGLMYRRLRSGKWKSQSLV